MRVARSALFTLFLSLATLLAFGNAQAQDTGTITGVVTDASTMAPLSGVQIQVAGTQIGGITNDEGRYLVTGVPPGQRTIRAILIGYSQGSETVTIAAGQRATADFALTTSAVPLQAIVVNAVTGREQRARELGSKVANIAVEDLNPAPVMNFADALGGRASGVIMQDVNGTTGTSQRIRIRGANSLSLSNEPLIYVDGVRIDNDFGGFGVGGQEPSRLNDINPNDISSMEVVKGPAASAMYGTAAANGVILITTKRGTPGSTQWTAFAEYGEIDDVTDFEPNYLTYQIDDPSAPLINANTRLFNTDAYSYCPNISAARGNCTQDGTLVFNTATDPRTTPYQTGTRQRYGANVRGGTEDVRFFVSGQYEDEVGVIEFNTLEKLNFRGNMDAKLASNADLSFSIGYTGSALGLNNNDNSIFSPIINSILGEAYYVEADENRQFGAPVNDRNYGFGFNMEELGYLVTFQDIDRYTTSANLRYRPLPWLSFNANGGLDLTAGHDFETLQPDRLPIALSYARGFRASQRSTDYLYTMTGSGTATFGLTDDLISTTNAGLSYERDNATNTYCYGSSLVPGTSSCGTTSALFDIDEDFFEVKKVGFYAQQQFAFLDRLFFDVGLRGDDNSAFGQDFGLAWYPSAAVSWVIADEPFFPDLNWLSTIRLRSAWGRAGLQPGFRQATRLFSPTTVASAGGDIPGVSLSVAGNPLLEPETSEEWEFGVDAGLFNDRLSLEFTYFDKQSYDALISRPLASSLGLTSSVISNLGSIENTGTELTANLMVYEDDRIALNVGATNTTLQNEILELGEDIEPIIFNRGLQRHEEGYTAGGFWQAPISWSDADGDGKLDISDVTVADETEFVGPSLPEWQRTFFADARFFDFLTVSTLFEGRGGHYTGNDTEAFRCGFRSSRGCAAVADPNASLEEQARYIADRYLGSAGGYVEEADFYKWRELSLTFSVPDAWGPRFSRAEGLRLTLAGRNLATWTDYTGLDPETVEGGGNANFSQSEFNTQPPVRYLMIRFDYTF